MGKKKWKLPMLMAVCVLNGVLGQGDPAQPTPTPSPTVDPNAWRDEVPYHFHDHEISLRAFIALTVISMLVIIVLAVLLLFLRKK
eukprot:gene4764-2349_t